MHAMDRCNFLIFVVDQMASASLGCNGNTEVQTPNLDRLAAMGTTFTRAYFNNPVCQPSRATMPTGLTPRQHGLVSNGNLLDGRVPTITTALAEIGYRTHSVGELHLQPFVNMDRNCRPEDPVESWESEYPWRRGRIKKLPTGYYGFQTAELIEGHGDYSAGDYSNWLNQNHPDPGSLYVDGDTNKLAINPSWQHTDDPCPCLAGFRTGRKVLDEAHLREITAETYGMITHIDEQIGRVLAHLEDTGRAENTVLVFLEADPHETHNLWDDPACAAEKARLILRLLEELAMSDRMDAQRIATA
jgi:arylsulfatase A-like enzyme